MGFFLGPIGALLTVSTIFPLSVKGFRSFRFTLKKTFQVGNVEPSNPPQKIIVFKEVCQVGFTKGSPQIGFLEKIGFLSQLRGGWT